MARCLEEVATFNVCRFSGLSEIGTGILIISTCGTRLMNRAAKNVIEGTVFNLVPYLVEAFSLKIDQLPSMGTNPLFDYNHHIMSAFVSNRSMRCNANPCKRVLLLVLRHMQINCS